MVINIKGNDTTYNGKSYDELSNVEKERLKEIHEDINQKHKEIEVKMRELEKLHFLRTPNPPKHPKSSRHPKAPSAFERSESRVIVIPEIPDVPNAEYFKEFSVAPFNFSFDSGFPNEGMQSFTYNDGDKFLSVKMANAKEEEFKRLNKSEDTESKIKLKVDPNENQISLKYQFEKSGKLEINVYDGESKVVKTETIKNYDGKEAELKFNIDDLDTGKYYVEFNMEGNKVYKKLFINK